MSPSKTTVVPVVTIAAVIIGTTALLAAGPDKAATEGKEVTLRGRLVDIHNFITESYTSADRERPTREALSRGVPAALETADGLILLGVGKRGELRPRIKTLAYAETEVTGVLFEKQGIRYVDVSAIKSASTPPAMEYDEGFDEDREQDEN